jgi:hypothetical protein
MAGVFSLNNCTIWDTIDSFSVAKGDLKTSKICGPAGGIMSGGSTKFELIDHTVKKGSFAKMHKTSIIIVQKPEQQSPPALQVVPVVGLQGHRKPTRIWYRRRRSPFGKKGCWARSQLLVPCAMGLGRRLAGPFATRSHFEIVALPSCQDGCNRKPSRRQHHNRT